MCLESKAEQHKRIKSKIIIFSSLWACFVEGTILIYRISFNSLLLWRYLLTVITPVSYVRNGRVFLERNKRMKNAHTLYEKERRIYYFHEFSQIIICRQHTKIIPTG